MTTRRPGRRSRWPPTATARRTCTSRRPTRRWEAIEGDAEGWQTFLSTSDQYLADLAEVMAVTGPALQLCVRADVGIAADAAAPMVGERGRVTCTVDQLGELLRTWRQLPVDHILLSLRGTDPLATLRTVRESL